MAAKIIAVANQKGGCGKTTLAMQIAGTLGEAGYKVLVGDADPQGTAQRWGASAEDDKPFPANIIGLAAFGNKVHRELGKFIDDYDYIVVDCPPSVESATPQSVLMVADMVIVPVIPSPPDLWAAIGIRDLIENIRDTINEPLRARLVINMCRPNTNLAQEAVEVLEEFGIPICATMIGQRDAYRQSAVFGGTVHSFGYEAKKAQEEIESLVAEILETMQSEALSVA
jgi:chromosome partitioning protein